MLIILIFSIVFAENTYTVHVFDKSIENNNTKYPELYAVQHIYNSVQKRVTLKDGRKVMCQIPITQISKPLVMDKVATIRNLTEVEANHILFPLEDQCVHHFTKEFIYEYCFRKYIRQFDDLNTMTNMHKLLKENFYLGTSAAYIPSTNETQGIHTPNNSDYYLDTAYHQIQRNGEELLIIEECVAKIRNYNIQFLRTQQYQIYFVTDTGHQFLKVLVVVHSQLLILEQCVDSIIVTDFFQITKISSNTQDFQLNKFYAYRNLIFGLPLRAQEMFHPQQTLGIIFSEKVHLVQVEKVLDFSTISVTGFKFANRKKSKQNMIEIKNIIVMDTNSVYEEMTRPIDIVENIVFFSWVDLMDINDRITIFDSSISFSYVETYRIISYQYGIAVLDKQLTKGLRYSGKAFLKRNGQYNFAENITHFQNPSLSLDESKSEYQMADITIDSIQVYIFKQAQQDQIFKSKYQQYIGITFLVVPLRNYVLPQLFIQILSKMYVKTEISILTVPQHNIFVKTQNGPFKQMEARFANHTVMSRQYWIVIDTTQDMLYIGRDYDINLVNKILEFKLERLNQDEGEVTFCFDKKSNDVKLEDIIILPLKNFASFETETLSGRFTPLNYTGQGAALYHEHFVGGSFCKPINSTRHSEVILSCYPDNLLRFLSIYENDTCNYTINIGTYLLCDRNYQVVEPSEQHIMCVLQQ